jgi:peptidoglycan/xylan/chitin deacetylase (PgdA/CDA1 family)
MRSRLHAFKNRGFTNTPRVLDALKAECVKASFFVIGAVAKRSPALMRRIYDEGHSIGTHSMNHPVNMPHIPQASAEREIGGGIAAVRAALGPGRHLAPFFRFPALNRTGPLENYAAAQGLMVWSADHYADDWMKISPEEVAARPLRRLERAGRGVVLMHDIQGRTAAALPAFLRGLKERGFRVVHVVGADPKHQRVASAPSDWRALDKSKLDLPPHMRALPQY